MKTRILLAACICASLAGPLAMAQSAPPTSASQMSMQDRHDTSKADATFAKKASAGNLAEVKMGKLAVSQGTDSAVKDFGQRMITDHSAANEKLQGVAQEHSMMLSQEPTAAQQKEYKKLAAMHGSAFDHAYAKHAVQDHQTTIRMFEKEAKSGKNAALKDYASQTLPTLKEHLSMAQKLPQK